MEGPGLGAAVRHEWTLDDDAVFLNHGSFGATPRVVLDRQAEWRAQMERQPVLFMNEIVPQALRESAGILGGFVGAEGTDLVFTANATAAVNAVLSSLPLRPGDQVVTTAQAYPAVRNALRHYCRSAGTDLTVIPLPLPVANEAAVTAAVEAALTSKTRLAVFDHVTSHSAIILPVAALAALCRDRGVLVLIDGAHAPGMLDLDIAGLGVDWYAGNCHKWLCAPKGAGFLWARGDRQDILHPTVISNQYGHGFTAEFDWTGTADPTPALSVPAAIDFHETLGGAGLRAHNASLADKAARSLVDRLGTEAAAPAAMRGAMAAVRLPPSAGQGWETAAALHDRLWHEHRIEVPVLAIDDALWVRISAQAYNAFPDYVRLGDALERMGVGSLP